MNSWTTEPEANSAVHLHISHSWGGGLERWIKDFSTADSCKSLVLKSIGTHGLFQRLALYEHTDDLQPIRTWELRVPIPGTTIVNLDYARLLNEIIHDFPIETIFVSTFIGQSLEILSTGIKTIIIGHDYYPFCPALYIYFGKVCTECRFSDLQKCYQQNELNVCFPANATGWMKLRDAYVESILTNQIPIVIPTASVQKNLTQLEPRLAAAKFYVIPHGAEPLAGYQAILDQFTASRKLRILILGRFTIVKGQNFFRELYQDILETADIYLLGCGDSGDEFAQAPGIKIVAKHYTIDELPAKVAEVSPDLCLFLSICPETFCYTLSEAFYFGIPPLATKTGGAPDERITDGVTGFLVAPEKTEVLQKIRDLAANREQLAEVSINLKQQQPRNLAMMVADYHELLSTLIPVKPPAPDNNLALTQAQGEIAELEVQVHLLQRQRNDSLSRVHALELDILWFEEELTKCIQIKDQAEASVVQLQQQLLATESQLSAAKNELLAIENSNFGKLRKVWSRLKKSLILSKD